jgi:beta-glucoside kinase
VKKYITFDVGGTNVKHGVILENGTFLSKNSYTTQCTNLEDFLKDMVDTIRMYSRKHEISGVAISLPGFVNPQTGFTERGGAVTALNNQNLKKLLEARIPFSVEIENDGNCAAIAEKNSGNARNCSDFICLTIGTGIGGGIFINGKPLHGHSFRGGEFGFMITSSGGNESVMHDNASITALIHSYKILKGISEAEKINGKIIFEESEYNEAVRRLIDDWIRNICYGIFNLAATLNPQKILIGGGVTAQPDLIRKINDQLNKFYWWKQIKVPVERCMHQNEAGMIGAMYHFIEMRGR